MSASNREVAALAFSVVPSFAESMRLRAARWYNYAHQLGLHIPLCVAHDIGQLFAIRRDHKSATIGPSYRRLNAAGASAEEQELARLYAGFCLELQESEMARRCQTLQLEDDVISVLLAKLFTPIYRVWPVDNKRALMAEPLPIEPSTYSLDTPQPSLSGTDRAYVCGYLKTILAHRLQVQHALEQIDIDTLRLLGLFKADMGQQTPIEMIDLLGLFSMPMVNDVVNFSLQILPSVLEATKQTDAQIMSMNGFEGVERLGQIDNLMLTEFAYDEEVFLQKFLENELFYYSRARVREEEQKLHYLLVDSSASMRGRRSVFARGVALAMIKKLIRQGEKPMLRFFDSQLHDLLDVSHGFSVPYLLSFRGERGRNYRKVFDQVVYDVRRLKEKHKRDIVVYILTHGHCHIPTEIVARLGEAAYTFGIFILPDEKMELDYLEMLDKTRTIRAEVLQNHAHRNDAAIEILNEL